jgi:tetratricopeptide (TPR) repeat protein
VQNADRLSAYDRLLLEALLAWRRGDAPEAERLYRTAIGQHPDDMEAWFQLGEVLFHGGPPRGRALSESREAFERVLSFESDHVPSMLHLGRLAGLGGDREALSRIESRALELNPDGERALEARGMLAFGLGDRGMEGKVLEAARRASDGEVAIASNTVVVFSGDPRGSAALVRVLTDPARAPETRTLGRVWLAQIETLYGRLAAARSELEAAAPPAPAWAIEARANLLLLPFVPVPRPRLEALQAELSRWNAATVPDSASGLNWVNVHDGLHAHLRLYLLGILNARLGRLDAALENASGIERTPAPPVSATLPADLARSLRAQVAHARGRGREVLDLLTPPVRDLAYTQGIASPYFSRPQDRWLLAETLESQGRNEEALTWFGSFDAHSAYDEVYLAPSHLRRGRIWEKLGQAGQAAASYRRFLDLWRDADPELKPLLDEAKAALARLE